MKRRMFVGGALVLGGSLALSGCEQPTLFPNPDPSLRLTTSQLASDAAKRFPYHESAPHGVEPNARAQTAYTLNRLEIVNFSNEDWSDVEIWVNRKYVCHVPKMESRKLKEIHFPMLYDERGQHFPMDNRQTRVDLVEVYRDGKMYRVKVEVADS